MSGVGRLRRALATRRARGTPLQRFYDAAPPDRRRAIARTHIVAVDLETTGLDPARDRILEMAWCPVEQGRVRLAGARRELLRSDATPGASAAIHGIVDSDVEHGRAEADALLALLDALRGGVLLAHAAGIELGFIDAACRRLWRAPFVIDSVDTLRLEAHLDPDARGALRLHQCRERRHLPVYGAHRASTDAIACAELALAQIAELGGPSLPLRTLLRLT